MKRPPFSNHHGVTIKEATRAFFHDLSALRETSCPVVSLYPHLPFFKLRVLRFLVSGSKMDYSFIFFPEIVD